MSDDQFQQNPSDDDNPMGDMQREEKLAGDYTRPFSPPDDTKDRIDDTHQTLDSNVDEHEQYDAGPEAASGVDIAHTDDYEEAA